jgi:carboxypeptidase Taq
MLGYFPTYALGNLISVQFFDKAGADIPSLPEQIRTGSFEELLNWLREYIHQYGRKYLPDELVRRVTGNGLTATNYVAYIKAKFSEIYEI